MMKREEKSIEKIVNLLKKHPDGLTIIEISRKLNMNRITVSKYIMLLIGEKKVRIRRVGNAKLIFLRKSS